MGKFSGFLICSDIDGTFRGGGDTEKVNSDAVRYFTENGGRFTFTTGRTIGNLRETGIATVANAPICLCNGGVIFDNLKNRVIFKQNTDFTFKEFYDTVRDYGDMTLSIVKTVNDDSMYRVELCDVPSIGEDLMNIKPIKTVCIFKTPEEADKFKESVLSNPFFSNTCISKSWPVGVEFNSDKSTKGTAIKFIKKYLGDIHTSIGIGDYENDIPLIASADIGVAVGNALDSVKEKADIVVKPASQYAIADLINHIENKMI